MNRHPPSLIEADALCFSRNDLRIFGPLDFHVAKGETLLLKGDNGAGKTTLLRVLAGLLPAESGQVRMPADGGGNNTLAYLSHRAGHKAELTVLQNLRFAARLHGAEDGGLEALIDACGLGGYDDTPAAKLSAGQNKRLALARLQVQRSRLWLLDEPYANLDAAGIDWVNRLLQAHTARGGGALVSTHGAYAAPQVPVRVLVLDRSTAHA